MSDMRHGSNEDGSENGEATAFEDFDKETSGALPSHQNSVSNGAIIAPPSSSERTIEMKEKFKRQKRRESKSHPIQILRLKEAEKRDHVTHAKRLGRSIHASPDPNLLVRQILDAVGKPGLGSHLSKQVQDESISLYAALEPEDAIDSMLARQVVGLNHAIMGCFERAARTDSAQARDVELRHGIRGIKVFGDTLAQFESRRQKSRPMVTMDGEYKANGSTQHDQARGDITPPSSNRRLASQRELPNGTPRKPKR